MVKGMYQMKMQMVYGLCGFKKNEIITALEQKVRTDWRKRVQRSHDTKIKTFGMLFRFRKQS